MDLYYYLLAILNKSQYFLESSDIIIDCLIFQYKIRRKIGDPNLTGDSNFQNH